MPIDPTLAPGLPSAMHILTQESEAGGNPESKRRAGKKHFSHFIMYQSFAQVRFPLAHTLRWVYQHTLGNEMHICWSALIYPEGPFSACVCFKLEGVVQLFQWRRDRR